MSLSSSTYEDVESDSDELGPPLSELCANDEGAQLLAEIKRLYGVPLADLTESDRDDEKERANAIAIASEARIKQLASLRASDSKSQIINRRTTTSVLIMQLSKKDPSTNHESKRIYTFTTTKPIKHDPIIELAQGIVDQLKIDFRVNSVLHAAAFMKLYNNNLLPRENLKLLVQGNLDDKCKYIIVAPDYTLQPDIQMIIRAIQLNRISIRIDNKIEIEATIKDLTTSSLRLYAASLSAIQEIGLSKKELDSLIAEIDLYLSTESVSDSTQALQARSFGKSS